MGKILRKTFYVFFIGLIFVSYSQASDLYRFNLPTVKVVSQNMYLGADLTPLFTNPNLIPAVIGEIIASNYPARAEAFARMFKVLEPDVICLQEAWIFEYLPAGIRWDFKELILNELGNDNPSLVTTSL